jgi:hypothetical protein
MLLLFSWLFWGGSLEDGEEAHDKFYKKMKESENGEEITL